MPKRKLNKLCTKCGETAVPKLIKQRPYSRYCANHSHIENTVIGPGEPCRYVTIEACEEHIRMDCVCGYSWEEKPLDK